MHRGVGLCIWSVLRIEKLVPLLKKDRCTLSYEFLTKWQSASFEKIIMVNYPLYLRWAPQIIIRKIPQLHKEYTEYEGFQNPQLCCLLSNFSELPWIWIAVAAIKTRQRFKPGFKSCWTTDTFHTRCSHQLLLQLPRPQVERRHHHSPLGRPDPSL